MAESRTTLEKEAKAKGEKYERAIYTTFMEYARDCGMRESEAVYELDKMAKNGGAEVLGYINVNGIGLNSMASVTELYAVFPPED